VATRRTRRGRKAPAPRKASPEETRLLALARELTALAGSGRPPADALTDALLRIGAGAAPGRRSLDKARRLALAWAREQARLALAELLERAARVGRVRVRRDVGTGTLAWLLLAAGEALAREPADVAADRVQALIDFIGAAGPRD
jgi:hypothetical protein